MSATATDLRDFIYATLSPRQLRDLRDTARANLEVATRPEDIAYLSDMAAQLDELAHFREPRRRATPKIGRLYQVKDLLEGCHRIHGDYPLVPGDVLAPSTDGAWTKLTGLGMCGFVLTDDQQDQLELLPEQSELQIVGNL